MTKGPTAADSAGAALRLAVAVGSDTAVVGHWPV